MFKVEYLGGDLVEEYITLSFYSLSPSPPGIHIYPCSDLRVKPLRALDSYVHGRKGQA